MAGKKVQIIYEEQLASLMPIINRGEKCEGSGRKFLYNGDQITVRKDDWGTGLYITNNHEGEKRKHSALIHITTGIRGVSTIEYHHMLEGEYHGLLGFFMTDRLTYADSLADTTLMEDDELGDSLLDHMEKELKKKECEQGGENDVIRGKKECLEDLRLLLSKLELTQEQRNELSRLELEKTIEVNGIPNSVVIAHLAKQYGIKPSDLEAFLKEATITKDNQPGEVLEYND